MPIIAIDPDVDKSGLAELNPQTKEIKIQSLPFGKLIEYLYLKIFNKESVLVVVEAGYLNRSNWHIKASDNARKAAAIGNHTGRNHEVARCIVSFCKHYNLPYVERKPLRKFWKGKDGKITHEEINKIIPGLPNRTNQETRDAALIAWVEAGFNRETTLHWFN